MPSLTIPNLLTFIRMVLTVFFVSAGLQSKWEWAMLLFAIAAFTDMIDGTVARLLKQRTHFGAFIDPMADKLMMLGGVMLLTVHRFLPWWFMALVVGRDLIIVGGLFYLMYRKISVEYRPTKLSKATTFFQILTIVLGMLTAVQATWQHFPAGAGVVTPFLPWSLLIATLLTFVTAVQYVAIGLRILKRQTNG